MEFRVVRRARLPHLPEDLEPTLAQATQRAGMALTLRAFRSVVSFGPGTLLPTEVGQEVDGGAESFSPAPGKDPNNAWSGCWAKSAWIRSRYLSRWLCRARS